MSETRRYIPDFILRLDNGLNLIVEIKGYRGEDAKEKKSYMDSYWIPAVNNLGTQGRWAFAEFREVFQLETDLTDKIESEFNRMVDGTRNG
jgi:type III restriction enzyme